MSLQEQQSLSADQIPTFLTESGLDMFFRSEVVTTRSGNPQLKIDGRNIAKTVRIDPQGGLERIRAGDIDFLMSTLGRLFTIPGSFSGPDLLKDPLFAEASLDRLPNQASLVANSFTQRLVGVDPDCLPVFYGSTAGLNIAELLETSLSALQARQHGIATAVVFDYEEIDSPESNAIFERSIRILPPTLRDRVTNFVSESSTLMQARLRATRRLIELIGGLPDINLVDEKVVFDQLRADFTIGQLVMLSKMAGNDPQLFAQDGMRFTTSRLLEKGLLQLSPIELLKTPVAEIIARGFQPLGFTFYAREARIGRFPGAIGNLLKLTDKGNIYKALRSIGALFDHTTQQGVVVFPATRQRIQIAEPHMEGYRLNTTNDKPVDPVVLMVLAEDQPGAFDILITKFRTGFRVLTPAEAIAQGTVDRRFYINQEFDLRRSEYE